MNYERMEKHNSWNVVFFAQRVRVPYLVRMTHSLAVQIFSRRSAAMGM
jgi:hypothetical protein